MEHSEEVLDALLVAGGDAAKLSKTVDQALHSVARPIGRAVEAGATALVALAGDHRTDAAPPQVVPRGPARKSLVAGHPARPEARAAALPADPAPASSRVLSCRLPPLSAKMTGLP